MMVVDNELIIIQNLTKNILMKRILTYNLKSHLNFLLKHQKYSLFFN